MEKEQTNLTLRKDVKARTVGAVENGYFAGVGSLTGLVEKALDELLNQAHVPKSFDKTYADSA